MVAGAPGATGLHALVTVEMGTELEADHAHTPLQLMEVLNVRETSQKWRPVNITSHVSKVLALLYLLRS